MTATAWQTVAVIFGVIGVIVTVYYSRLSATREAARMREAEIKSRIDAATGPRDIKIAEQARAIDRLEGTVATRDARIDVLEDELRRGRGHGDSDAQRQPQGG